MTKITKLTDVNMDSTESFLTGMEQDFEDYATKELSL